MSADTRAAFLKLRIQLSKEDVNSALRSIRTLQHEYTNLQEATEGVNRGRIQHIRVLNLEMQGYRKLGEEVKRTGNETRKAGELLKRYQAVRAQVTAGNNASLQAVGSAGRLTSGLGQLSRVAGIGGAGQALGVAADVAELTEELPRLKQAILGLPAAFKSLFAALGAGGILITGGIAALAFILTKLQEASAATRAEIEKQFAAQQSLIRIAQESTKEQLEAKIKQAQLEVDISEDTLKRAQANYDEAYQAYIENTDFFKDIPLFDAFSANYDILQQQVTALDDNRTALQDLIGLRDDENIAINTTTAEFEELIKQFHALQDLRVNTTISATLSASKLTEEQAKERLEAIQAETKAIEDGLLVEGQSEEQLDRLRLRIHELGIETDVLNDSMQQIRARDLAEDFKELMKIQQEVAELQAEHAEKMKDLEIELQEAREKAAKDYKDALVEAERDAQNARLEAARDRDIALSEAVRDAQLEREELERDHQKNLAKIQREFARSRESAIEDRDAVALAEAQRKRKEDERDEQDSYKERQRQLEKNLQEENRKINLRYQEQIRNIDMRLAEQQRLIDMRYQEQLQSIYIANQKALAAENERYAKEYQAKINAVNALLGIEAQGIQASLALQTQFWQYAVQLARNAGLQIASAYTGKPPLPSGAGSPPTSPGYKGTNPYISPPQLASGGYIQREGLAYLHAGETVIPARGRGSGMTLNINMNGSTVKTVVATSRRIAEDAVMAALDELGAA